MCSVTIRPIAKSDAAELIDANRASASLHRPWVQPFTDSAGFDAYFEGLDGKRKVGLVTREIATGHAVGIFTLSEIVRGAFQSAFLGFYGLEGQVGRGLMGQALRLVLAHAFAELDLHRVEANVQPGNERSIAMIRRAGFRKEGYSPNYLRIDGAWRDHERWAILSDEVVP